ncbi:hypothetical protein ACQYIJ_004381 [Enterobacter cloacae]
MNNASSQSCCHHGSDVRYLPAHIHDRVWIMVSKLKKRRMRRLKADVAWWREEAEDCRSRLLELAGEIDRLKKLVIRVPMPVLVTKEMVNQLYYTETKRCRTCNDGLRGGCSSCIFYKR